MEQTPRSEDSNLTARGGHGAVQVATIAARNYLASVILLGESLRREMPSWHFSALLIDANEEELSSYQAQWPWMTFLAPDALALDARTTARMQFYYGLTEYATAVKPSLLSLLLESSNVAMYLDPDIEVFGDLSSLAEAAAQHGIALTPHVMAPTPRDGKDTSEEAFLTTGQFNLGFIAVSRAAAPFLAYWSQRLERHAIIDFAKGYFTDQRWVDAVPSLFDHHIVRDPGCNVAYWNLHQRSLRRDDKGATFVDGSPLKFFHYSGHDAHQPLTLSKYAPQPRVSVTGTPVLRELLEERSTRLLAVNVPTPPYRWATLSDGRVVDASLRRGYWHAVDDAVRNSAPLPPAPSWTSVDQEFDAWLAAPTRSGLPRHALLFWRGDGEAQRLFPDPDRQRTTAFAKWLRGTQRFCSSCTPQIAAQLDALQVTDTVLPLGVNLWSDPKTSAPGAAANIAACLRATGLPVAEDSRHQSHVYGIDAVILHAHAFGNGHRPLPTQASENSRPRVGIVSGDFSVPGGGPLASSQEFAELWCSSPGLAAELQARGSNCPVFVHPWLIEEPPHTLLLREDLGLPREHFVFGMWVASGAVATSNVDAVVRAYNDACAHIEATALVIACDGSKDAQLLSDVVDRQETDSNVHLLTTAWNPSEERAFFQLIDAFVSVEATEGTGLERQRAMASGTPVIALDSSGNRSLLPEEGVAFVAFSLQDLDHTQAPHAVERPVMTPQHGALVAALHDLAQEPGSARERGARGRDSILQRSSRDVVRQWFDERTRAVLHR